MKKSMEHLMSKKHKMPEHEKSAKMSVLHDMKKHAEDEMRGRLGDMKKVSVASDSSNGLVEGLEKAKQLISQPEKLEGDPLNGEQPQELMHEVAPTHDGHNAMPFAGEETPGEEEAEQHQMEAEMSPEEIDEKIQHLLALKKLKSGK